MAIRAHCGACGRQVRAKDEAAGKRVKCPDCGEGITIPDGSTARTGQPKRRKKSARRKPVDEYADAGDDGELDFGALAAMASESTGLGAGELEPCIHCGREVGSKVKECPYCGELVQELKRERREEAKRERIRKQKAEEREIQRKLAAAEVYDDEDGSGWGWIVFILIFVVGNFILYHTTGWVIIPRR